MSVERLQELDNGKVEWRMATSSTPGGNIPQFVADSSMASTISHVRIRARSRLLRRALRIRANVSLSFAPPQDVRHFLTWLHKNRPAAPAGSTEAPAAAAAAA